MKRVHLAPVAGEPAPNAWFAAEAHALLTRVLAMGPTAIVILWEDDSTIHRGSVPRSDALVFGMVRSLHDAMEATNGPE